MSRIKRLAGETVLYGLGSILPRFLNFLLIKPHTGVFVPEEYAIVTKVFAYTAVLNTFFMFGMETAYFRFATRAGADEKKVFNYAQTVVLAISLITAALLFIFSDAVAAAVNIDTSGRVVQWVAAIMLIDAAVAIPFARLRLQKKAVLFAVGKLVNIFLLIGLNLYFLKVIYDPAVGVDYVFLANLIANSFFLVFFGKMLVQWRPAYNPEITNEMFRYGFPIMVTGLAGVTNEMFSRITLDSWLPAGFYPGRSPDFAVGVWGAVYKLAMLMSLAVTAFRYAAEPFFFSNAADKNSPVLFARVNHYFVIVCCLILVGVGVNLDIFKYFLGAAYWEGLHVVPVLLLAYLFLGVYYNFTVWFKLTDKTYWGTILAVGGVMITVVSNYFLIPLMGYEGSALAALLTYFFMSIACYFLGQKYYPIPYNLARTFSYIAGSFLLVILVNRMEIGNTWLASGFHILVVIAFIGLVFLLERKEFRESLR